SAATIATLSTSTTLFRSDPKDSSASRPVDFGDFTPGRHLKVRADGEDAPTKSEPNPFLGEDQDAARSVGRRHRVRVVPVSLLRRSEEHTSELQSRENIVC